MRNNLLQLAIIGVALLHPTVHAAEQQPFEATYTVANEKYKVGTATLSLQREKANWTFVSTTKPSGVFSLFSRGHVTETSLANGEPTNNDDLYSSRRYSFHQKKAKPGRNLTATFSPANNDIAISYEQGEATQLTRSEPTYDPLSSMLHIMYRLGSQQSGTLGTLELPVFSRGRVKVSTFTFQAPEKVTTPVGEFSAVVVIREGGNDRKTHTWYASEAGFLPVKIEQYKRGELVVRLSLKSLRQ